MYHRVDNADTVALEQYYSLTFYLEGQDTYGIVIDYEKHIFHTG